MTGVKAYGNTGISGEALGKVATGVRGALDAASKRELGILRRLAKGMTEIGRKIIAMNAIFLSDEEVIRVTNEEFITVKRDDLAGLGDEDARRDFQVRVQRKLEQVRAEPSLTWRETQKCFRRVVLDVNRETIQLPEELIVSELMRGALEPLDDFGTPNAGCTRIDTLNKTTGEWEPV